MKGNRLIVSWLALLFSVAAWAEELPMAVVDSISPDPEWYVAPVIPVSLRAPRRALATTPCSRVEAIQSFNIDSVLVEGTYYEYDAKGNVISTTVWTYNPDGTMTGKSKNEYAFDNAGTQTMTAVYIWDGAANNWKGTEKYEYVYKTFAGEKKMISNTSLVWLNGAWVADHRYTYNYDDAAREVEYYEYIRNTISNDLQPFKGHVQTWTNDLQTLDIQYTTYANGQWTAGTKKEWAFDGNGTQTMYATYTMSNGAWVGSSKETWTYGGPSAQLTLHEKYGWANNDWSITLQENTTYDASGNTTLIENYSWSNGIKTGTKKEQYSFDGGKKVQTIVYAWKNSSWVGTSNETWVYNTAGKLTLHEKSAWVNDDWSKTLREENEYSGANLIRVENYSYTNGVATGTKKEEYTYTGGKKTQTVTYAWAENDWTVATEENTVYSGANITKIENYTWTNGTKTGTQKEEYAYTGSQKTQEIIYAWTNDVWVESTKEVWGYTSGKLTHHETYIWNGDWSKTLEENTTYDGANITKIENYTYSDGVKTGTQKEEYTYTSGEKTMTVVYAWANNDWVYSTKNEAGYWDGNVEVSATNYAWNGSTWIGTGTRTKTTYDGTKVIEKLTENWPSSATEWTNAAITTNAYNAEDINVLVYNGTWDGSKWVLHSMARLDIIKDATGHELLNASWTCGIDSVWVGVKKDTAAYTATNKPLYVASYKSWSNGNWVPYSKSEYTYDANDHQILYMQYEGKNGVWVNKSRYENSYDSEGRELLKQAYTWSKNAWVGSYKYEYEYDADGNQTKYIQYKWSNGKWKGYLRTDKSYDSHGNVTMTISYDWYGNAWVGSSREDCVYDENNRLIESIQKEWDDEWINFRRITNYYDNLGRNVSVRNYWWYNNEWALFKIEDKEYELSSNVLRRELSASWLNNKLQSYVDKQYFYNCDPHFYTVRFVNYDGIVLANMTAQEGETPTYVGSNPTREGNAEYSYTFSGWNPTLGPVTSNVTYTATFTPVKNQYTITWLNDDDSQIDQTTVEYGIMPTHANPTKENTAEYTYTFAGWTPGIGIVTSDAEYTATFTQTKRSYVISFKNEDGSLISTAEVEYGTMPTAPANPTKAATAEWTYTFAGWDKEIISVAEATTYTATFTATKNTYTVTWKNEDGSTISTATVEYGQVPAEPTAPSKPADGENTYTFAGWTPQVEVVTGNAEYTATFTATKNSYTITFKNEDGYVLKSSEVEYGVIPTAPESPIKPNTAEYTYTFAGWDKEVVAVEGDATYNATFTATKNKYLVTFKDEDGTTLKSEELEYGVTPVAPEYPTKASTAEYTYAFTGWNVTPVAVTGPATYKATYSAIKNKYTITWLDDDETQIDQTTVEYGVVPTHDDPAKQATAEFTYTFAGWSPAVTSVTGNATYKATYTDTINQYTISWLDDTGTLVDQTKVAYGSTPAHANIYKESDDQYDYTFVGWTPTLVPVTGDASYSAIFTTAGKSYTVTFYFEDGVTILDQMTLPYGAIPSTPYIPSIPSDANHTYTFSGWSPEIAPVTGDISYVPTFTAIPNQYIVIFRNYNGKELQRKKVDYGTIPAYEGEEPSRPATNSYTWAFEGWTPELTAVIGDATYTAVYIKVMNTYTILFYDEDGTTLLDEVTVEHGQKPITSVVPTKEADEEYIYTFAGWSPKIAKATADAEYTATYMATPKTQGLNNTEAEGAAIKVIIEDKIYIRRGGNTYSIDGQRVK